MLCSQKCYFTLHLKYWWNRSTFCWKFSYFYQNMRCTSSVCRIWMCFWIKKCDLEKFSFFFFLAELRESKSFHWCFLVEKLLFDKLDVKYKRNPDILFKFVWRRIQSNFTKMKIIFVCENLKSCAASVLPNASVLFGLLLLVQKYPVTPFQDSVLSPGATWKIRKVVFTHILQTVQTTLQSFSLNPN